MYTTPWVPSPIFSTFSKLSIDAGTRRGGAAGGADIVRARRERAGVPSRKRSSVLFAVFFKAKRRARFQTAPTHGDCSQVHNLSASVVDGAPARLPRSNVFWQKQTTLASLAASRLASSRLFGVSLSWAPTPTPSRGSWRPRPRRPPSRSPARRAREARPRKPGAPRFGRRRNRPIRRPSRARPSNARTTRVRTTRAPDARRASSPVLKDDASDCFQNHQIMLQQTGAHERALRLGGVRRARAPGRGERRGATVGARRDQEF